MLSAPKQAYTKSLWAVRSHARATQPPATGDPLVSARGITAGYGDVSVLHDVSFDIHRRRTVAVVGESGLQSAGRVVTVGSKSRGAVRREGLSHGAEVTKANKSDFVAYFA